MSIRPIVDVRDVEAFIAQFHGHGRSPSIREAAQALTASLATIHKLLTKPKRRGRIRSGCLRGLGKSSSENLICLTDVVMLRSSPMPC